nr:glutamate receptor ionotropic, delta-2-like [Lepeophtheirus salmonis]
MSEADVPISNFDPATILQIQMDWGKDDCPIYRSEKSPNITYPFAIIPENKIFKRRMLIPYYKNSHLIIIMVKNIQSILKAMEMTVMDYCDEKTDRGIYHSDTKIIFLRESSDQAFIIFSNQRVLEHPSVAVFQKNIGTQSSYTVLNVDHFQGNKIINKFLWTPSTQAKSFDQIYPNYNDFNNYELQIIGLPYSFHVTGVERDNSDPLKSKNNTYKDYWGFEIDILYNAAKNFNFKYKIWNPPDGLWGSIEDDGKWSGSMEYAKSGKVDFAMSAILQNYPRRLVADPTIHFENDYLVTLSRKPTLVPQYFAFIMPFQPYVWLIVYITFIIMALIFTLISKQEEKIIHGKLESWSTMKSSLWFSYGTFVGESVTRDTKSHDARALRWAIAVWFIYCFVMSAAYGGELKAYLTTPTFSNPINTLEDVVENDLPWGMILYGELEESIMAQSKDKIVQKIWADKIVLEYQVLPQIEPVYKGEMILIDWKNGLTPGLKVEFSTSGGDPLLYMSPHPIFMNNYSGWAFKPFNPWKKIFDKFILQCKEMGLIKKWIELTFSRMNDEFLQTGKPKKKELDERPPVSPLTFNDTQGIFFLFIFVLSFPFLAFGAEFIRRYN